MGQDELGALAPRQAYGQGQATLGPGGSVERYEDARVAHLGLRGFLHGPGGNQQEGALDALHQLLGGAGQAPLGAATRSVAAKGGQVDLVTAYPVENLLGRPALHQLDANVEVGRGLLSGDLLEVALSLCPA